MRHPISQPTHSNFQIIDESARDESEVLRRKAYKHYLRNSYANAGVICPVFSVALLIGAVFCVRQAATPGATQTDMERTFLLWTAFCSVICAIVAHVFYGFLKRKASSFAQEALDCGVRNERDISNLFASIEKP